MQAIQNRSIRTIFKKYIESSEEIENLAAKTGLSTIANRLSELNERYVLGCLDSGNPLIVRLVKEYGDAFQGRT